MLTAESYGFELIATSDGSFNDRQTILCGSFEEAQAVAVCKDCELYLCEVEAQVHRKPMKKRNHTLCSLSQLPDGFPTNFKPFKCSKRSHGALKLYCNTCEELVCRDCVLQEHRQHDTWVIAEGEEAIAQYKSELKKSLNQAKEANQTKRKESLSEVIEMERKVNMRAEAAVQQVKQTFAHMVGCLQERQTQLLNEIEQVKVAKLDILSTQRGKLETMLGQVASTCETCEVGIEANDNRQFLSLKSTIRRQIEEINQINAYQQPEEDDWLDCCVDGKDEFEQRIEQFGRISRGPVCVDHCVIEGVKEKLVGEPLQLKVVLKDNQMNRKSRGGDRVEVEGIQAVVDDNNDGSYNVVGQFGQEGEYLLKVWINGKLKDQFWVAYWNAPPRGPWFTFRDPKVKFCFGKKGGEQGQFRYPSCVCINRQGNIIVSEEKNHRIQVFDGNGNFLRMWGSKGIGKAQFRHPAGVAVDVEGNVVVADTGNNRIQVFDGNGNFIRMWGSKGTGPAQFHGPSGLAVDGEGNVVVADSANRRIQVFDGDGNFLRMWGSEGAGPAQFAYPGSVAVDGVGNVLVCDEDNHNIQVFDGRGNFVRMWGSKGIDPAQFNTPASVAVDREGHVIVTDTLNERIQVFDGRGTLLRMWCYNGRFMALSGVAVDGEGNIVVANCCSNRIQVLG